MMNVLKQLIERPSSLWGRQTGHNYSPYIAELDPDALFIFWYIALSSLVHGVFCRCFRASLLLTVIYSSCIIVFASIYNENVPREKQSPYNCRTISVFNMSKFNHMQIAAGFSHAQKIMCSFSHNESLQG